MEVSREHLDSVQEMTQVGMRHGAQLLSNMTGLDVVLEAYRVEFLEMEELQSALMRSMSGQVSILYQRLVGSVKGIGVVVLPKEAGISLSEVLVKQEQYRSPSDASPNLSLSEIQNTVIHAWLGACVDALGIELSPAVSDLETTAVSSILESTAAKVGLEFQHALLITVDFLLVEIEVQGYLMFALGPDSARILLDHVQAWKSRSGGTPA